MQPLPYGPLIGPLKMRAHEPERWTAGIVVK